MFEAYNQYIAPTIAAGLATIPTYFPLETKTALQLGRVPARFSLKRSVIEGIKAAPTMGGLIGAQIITQGSLEKTLNEVPKVQDIAISSIVVGGASIPFCAILNGQTMGWCPKKSLKKLTHQQACAIVIREAIFLFSLKISTPLNQSIKEFAGPSKEIEYATIFSTMAIGSVLSHPADSFFTQSQAGEAIRVKHLMKGSLRTAAALGVFGILNQFFYQKIINS